MNYELRIMNCLGGVVERGRSTSYFFTFLLLNRLLFLIYMPSTSNLHSSYIIVAQQISTKNQQKHVDM